MQVTRTRTAELAEQAAAAADRAARGAGVVVRELTAAAELRAAHELTIRVWDSAPHNPPVTAELLRAFGHAGGYVSGAFAETRLVGVGVGFLAGGGTLHSHLTAVDSALRGRQVGYALKLHQRGWALRRGITEIGWTFDPLVRRNAYFNLAKLGALPVAYVPDFYGAMDDGLNAGDESDRLIVCWQLAGERATRAAGGTPVELDLALVRGRDGGLVGLDQDATGWPRPGEWAPGWPIQAGPPAALVRIPPDIGALRAADPRCAAAWRVAVRETLGSWLLGGAAVSGYCRDGWYVVDVRGDRP